VGNVVGEDNVEEEDKVAEEYLEVVEEVQT